MSAKFPIITAVYLFECLNKLRTLVAEESEIILVLLADCSLETKDKENLIEEISEEGIDLIRNLTELRILLEIVAPYLPVRIDEDILIYLYKNGNQLTEKQLQELGQEIKYRHFADIINTISSLNDGKDWEMYLSRAESSRKKQEEKRMSH